MFSIDTIGCQRTITKLLVEKKADYVIGLKANQEGLYDNAIVWPWVSGECLKANQEGLYEQVVDWFQRG